MPPHDVFRRLALGMRDAVEGAHMNHPDFRVGGRIFATLQPGGLTGMVKLTPEQQAGFVADHPEWFSPESGAWGRQGCTRVQLTGVDEETLGHALTLAWQNIARAPRQASRAGRPAVRRRTGGVPRRPGLRPKR